MDKGVATGCMAQVATIRPRLKKKKEYLMIFI